MLFCTPRALSALAGAFAKIIILQGGFDVPFCGGCALLVRTMNIRSTEGASFLVGNGGVSVWLSLCSRMRRWLCWYDVV